MSKSYDFGVDLDGDETDEVQGTMIDSMNSQLSARDMDKFARINLALKKIENNCYGVCEECEEDISTRRLEFNPYFSTCISCAEELELQAKNRKRFST
jgi:DnaK suppressor protein